MIDIICGRPHRLWEPMLLEIALAYHAGEQVVLLVPEQYTLQAERDLLSDLHLPGFFRLEILSPSRLEYRVFEEYSADIRAHIDERGKLVALTRALQQTARQMVFYTGSDSRPGFVKRMSKMLSTLKGLNITAADLLQAADRDEADKPLWSKLRDTAIILTAYEGILQGRFADREDVTADMLCRLKKAAMFEGKRVFVYGFDVLTEALSEILLSVGGQAGSLSLYMVSDMAQAQDGDAFQAVQESIVRLMDRLKEQGLAYQFNWLPAAPLSSSNDLAHLEQSLLSLQSKVFASPPQSLRLYAAPTPYQEVQHMAQQIVLDTRQGVGPDDIMILCGNLPLYRGLIASTFDSFGIPYYLSDKLPLTAHPIVRAMLSALRCAADGYRTEDVEDYIKSGFSPLTHHEGWTLLNYARSYGIKKQKWLAPFYRGKEEEQLTCEALRLQLIEPLESLHKNMVEAETCTSSFRCLIRFFEQSGIYLKAQELEDELEQESLQKQAAQLRQVFDLLEEIFEQMSALMDEERIPLKHFSLWLENGMSQQEIGSLPQGSGHIQVGQLGNLLPHRPKVVFVLGLNDGVLSASDEGLLTQEETQEAEQIFKSHFGLDPVGREKMAALDLLKAMSSPRERLYVSYALANEEGGVLYPLREVKDLQRIFPLLLEEGGALSGRADDAASLPISPNPTLETLALMLQKGELSSLWQQAWAWMGHDEEYRKQAMALLDSMQGEAPAKSIGKSAAESIFDTQRSSVSRLESYASCPFRHFVDYGLKPHQLEEWTIQPVDTGRFYHDAMDRFTQLAKQEVAWPDIDREASESLMDTALEPLVATWQELPFFDTARLRKVSQSYVKVARRMAWVVTQGAKQGDFRPVLTELRFGQGGILPPILLTLPDGSLIELHGIIDRLDRYQGDEGDYLRIIDYKSGSTSLSAEKIYTGAQLQLLIYLKAALNALPEAIPAGAFYQRLTDPLIDTEDADNAEKAADKRLQLSGIILKDLHVVRLMDGFSEKTLGPLFNKDKSPKKNKPLLTEEEMRAMCDHSQSKAADLAAGIVSGDIQRIPAVYQDKKRACDFCPHQGICRIDWHHNATGRLIPRMTMEELLVAISTSEDTAE